MRRLAIPGIRGTAAIRSAQAANFPHRGTLQHRQRSVDPVTRRETITFVDGDVVDCRMNPASGGGLNVVAGQDTVAGEWIVSFPWDIAGLRENDRVLVQQGDDSEAIFAELVTIKRILRPRSSEVVMTTYCSSVELNG